MQKMVLFWNRLVALVVGFFFSSFFLGRMLDFDFAIRLGSQPQFRFRFRFRFQFFFFFNWSGIGHLIILFIFKD